MEGSSPPFLYGPSFLGPTDRPFNPKAVTQASWTPRPPKPKPNGPLVKFDRQDTYTNIVDGRSRREPMSPRTKGKVKFGRKIQLVLRILALIGAAGSLFCSVAIKGAAVMTWSLRIGPIVAILHTIYGVYHLCRSMERPPGSQASYMAFAATFDLGLIPFYAFAAYVGHVEYTAGSYNWQSFFDRSEATHKIARAIFLVAVANGGLHTISLGISIFLAVIFHQITRLPPDMNPLEDNLTARPHKRNKSELTEKHLSHSTADSGLDDPLIGPPRQVPFMHTRGMSSGDGSSHFSSNHSVDNYPPQVPLHHDYSPRPGTKPEVRFRPLTGQPNIPTFQPVQNLDTVLARPTSAMLQNDPAWDPSAVPERTNCVSPASNNYVVYSSRSPSPVNDDRPPLHDIMLPGDDLQEENFTGRPPSSLSTGSITTVSSNSGFRNWLSYSQRSSRDIDTPITEDARGEYESLATHGCYANDEDMRTCQQSTTYDNLNNEQDVGDRPQINICLDEPAHEETQHSLPMNPLGMNPPTPQRTPDNTHSNPTNATRTALTDIPNLTPSRPDIPSAKGPRFYTSNRDNRTRGADELSSAKKSDVSQTKPEKATLQKRKSKAYSTLKQYESDSDDGDDDATPAATSREGDRRGRVVSNSGADTSAQRNLGLGSGLSYGSYIAGLGVGLGRRRDVSGKVAEEGRSGDAPAAAADNKSRSENTTPVRAAGWARFAGL